MPTQGSEKALIQSHISGGATWKPLLRHHHRRAHARSTGLACVCRLYFAPRPRATRMEQEPTARFLPIAVVDVHERKNSRHTAGQETGGQRGEGHRQMEARDTWLDTHAPNVTAVGRSSGTVDTALQHTSSHAGRKWTNGR
mmetsp:Transcript_10530/g.30375  ORF Transcript_10530/g.30375 Transcript_10530/m.30375 type:complete len:141 (-) Transcript_10530:154-576(-)